ncbi:CvpA family protein [Telmatospirillum sp.]|uniref:CvpA family protein n=1 Tax=Telmatospirillum sp. TaxID=2079197 RepID=UPI00283C9078|nr:CvpA family protein [Telmatospirillum sp.]MDR3437206.1 CvpA family protein [Telmatospirillum sp.]
MNIVDIGVVVVLLLSGVFALMRGFVYEVLAMAGWIAAALAALWGVPLVRPYVHQYISSPTLADIAGGVAIFLVALLLCSLLTHAVSRRVQRSAVSSVDRSLGFAFGLVRGLVLASLCFMVVTKLMAPNEPQLLTSAKTRPLLAAGAQMIQSLVPAYLRGVEDSAKDAANAVNQAQQAKEMYDRLATPKPKSADQPQNDKQPAYDSHSLERLIETTTGK